MASTTVQLLLRIHVKTSLGDYELAGNLEANVCNFLYYRILQLQTSFKTLGHGTPHANMEEKKGPGWGVCRVLSASFGSSISSVPKFRKLKSFYSPPKSVEPPSQTFVVIRIFHVGVGKLPADGIGRNHNSTSGLACTSSQRELESTMDRKGRKDTSKSWGLEEWRKPSALANQSKEDIFPCLGCDCWDMGFTSPERLDENIWKPGIRIGRFGKTPKPQQGLVRN